MTTEGKGSERRRFPRVLKRLLIKYRCVQGAPFPETGDKVGAIEEVSKGGMILKARNAYAAAAVLRLFFPESAMGPARTLHGRVVWSRPTDARDGFQIGLQFVKFDEASQPVMTEAQKARTTRRYEASDLGAGAERHTKRMTAKPAAAQTGSERRKHPRWEQRILVKYRCVTKGLMHEVDARVGMLLDFSRGGLVVMALREYSKGMVLEIKMPETPVGPAQTVHAQVLWTSPHEKPGQYRVGGEFVKPVE